jgi:N-acetylglucosamine-6-phosphate deacetylase
MRLRSERVVTPSGTVAGELSIRDGRIEAVTPRASSPGGSDQTLGDTIDLGQRWVVPGYIDTHVHGGGGAQCNTSDPDEIAAVARFHATGGTTALLPTTVSAPPEELERALAAIAQAMRRTGHGVQGRDGAVVLGAHLEGPFLSRARPGAMDPNTFLDPDLELLDRLLVAAEETARWMTIAPELPGASGLVRRLADAGVVASVGHSDATYEQTLEAVSAGARAATHAFDAMRPFHHREPGVLGAVLDRPEVSCELICDGVHVAPAALRLAYRAKGPQRIRLVTDAMQAAGMPSGEYLLGSAKVTVADGRATVASGSIAGSTLTMGEAVRNTVRFLGLRIEEVVLMASSNPARMLGLEERKGMIAPGMDADLTVLEDDLDVCGTIVGGEWIHGAPDGEG